MSACRARVCMFMRLCRGGYLQSKGVHGPMRLCRGECLQSKGVHVHEAM